MNSLYYKIQQTGYIKTDQQPPLNSDLSRHLPVYRTVSEYMNLEPRQGLPQTYYGKEKQSQNELNKSSSPDIKVKYVTLNPSQIMEKDEVRSIYTSVNTDDGRTIYDKNDKSMSLKNISSSRAQTIAKGRNEQSYSDAATIKPQLQQTKSEFNRIENELERQKALRNQLESRYQALLSSMQKNTKKQQCESVQVNITPLKLRQKQYPKTDRQTQLGQSEFYQSKHNQIHSQREIPKTKERQRSYNYLLTKNNQNLEGEEDQDLYRCHLDSERKFQGELQSELFLIRIKIQELQNRLLKGQVQLKESENRKIILQNENSLLKQSLQFEKMKTIATINNSQNGLAKKEHIHYIFTILIVFLCLVVVAKNKN